MRAQNTVTSSDGLLEFVYSDPLEKYRVETLFTKEPETPVWIDTFAEYIKQVNGKAHFWDIGANIGCYALYAARKHPQLQVIAFEPFFKNFSRIRDNIEQNQLQNCEALYCALSDMDGLTRFQYTDNRIGASGGTVEQNQISEEEPSKILMDSVFQFKGDGLVQKDNLAQPNFIKIDVDGIELRILQGMSDILRSPGLRSILVEVNNREEHRTIDTMFQEYGLKPDDRINKLEVHSNLRRMQNKTNPARNWVYSRDVDSIDL